MKNRIKQPEQLEQTMKKEPQIVCLSRLNASCVNYDVNSKMQRYIAEIKHKIP